MPDRFRRHGKAGAEQKQSSPRRAPSWIMTDAGVTWREIRDASFFNISGNFRQALGMGGEYAASHEVRPS